MRRLAVAKAYLLYAEESGNEIHMQNKQGETLFTVDKEHFEKVYLVIGKEDVNARTWEEERNTLLVKDTGNG